MLKLGEFLKGFKSGLSDIRTRIGKYNAQEIDIQARPMVAADMLIHIKREIAASAQAGEEHLLGLQNELEPGKAQGLIFQRSYNPNHDISKLFDLLNFFLADIETDKIEKLFADKWPKTAISLEEREKRLKEIRNARAAAEREEEAAIMELETQGVNIARRGDENPEIFLNWNGKDFDRAKLEDFHSASLAKQAAATEVSQSIAAVAMHRRELESCLQRATLKSDEERFQKELDRLRQEQARLMAKRDELERSYAPTLALYNRCSEFLRKQGVQI